ncbi:MAG: hypothetical protein ACI8PZ_005156 [Myxococcota bacterium]|jgi:hypothetical protein
MLRSVGESQLALRRLYEVRALLVDTPDRYIEAALLESEGMCLFALDRFDDSLRAHERHDAYLPGGRPGPDGARTRALVHLHLGQHSEARSFAGWAASRLEGPFQASAEQMVAMVDLDLGYPAAAVPVLAAAIERVPPGLFRDMSASLYAASLHLNGQLSEAGAAYEALTSGDQRGFRDGFARSLPAVLDLELGHPDRWSAARDRILHTLAPDTHPAALAAPGRARRGGRPARPGHPPPGDHHMGARRAGGDLGAPGAAGSCGPELKSRSAGQPSPSAFIRLYSSSPRTQTSRLRS